MNKLLNWVKRKFGKNVRDALEMAILVSSGVLAFVMVIAEMIVAYLSLNMMPEHFWKGLMFLALDFVAFAVTVFFACLLLGWGDNND